MTKTSSKTTAVFLMGFIASGKDTQARLLKEKNGFLIISSNEIIKDNFKTNPDNKDVKLVKDQYYSGILIEPSIIAKWVVEDVRKKYKSGISIVFSGSPRTLYEAENELPEIINFYGQDNVKLFFIDISEKEARKRNIMRNTLGGCGRKHVRVNVTYFIPFNLNEHKIYILI